MVNLTNMQMKQHESNNQNNMKTEENYISSVVSFLKYHECPLLNSMPLEEVFDSANMSYLVSWAFCLWRKDHFETILQNRQQDKAFLAELLNCYGFCTSLEEAHSLLNAEQTPEEQILLIYGMLKFMEHTIRIKIVDEHVSKPITDTELDALDNLDMNLFPAFGTVISLTDQDRHEKLKVIGDALGKTPVECTIKAFSNFELPQSKLDLCNIDENLRQFEHLTTQLKKCAAINDERSLAVDGSFSDTLKNCNTTIKDLTEHLGALKTIEGFKIGKLELPEDQQSRFVSALYQLCTPHFIWKEATNFSNG